MRNQWKAWLAAGLLLGTFPNPSFAQQTDPEALSEKERQAHFLSKGQVLLMGDFGFGLGFRSADLGINNSVVLADMHVNTAIGVLLRERWLLGASGSRLFTLASLDYQNAYLLSVLQLGPVTRYYFRNGFFTELRAGPVFGREELLLDDNTAAGRSFIMGGGAIGAGVNNYWFNSFSLDLAVRYHLQAGRYRSGEGAIMLSGFVVSAGLTVPLRRLTVKSEK